MSRGRLACLGLILAALLGVAVTARAALCTDVYRSDTGINPNLLANGNALDLSAIPWGDAAWPASGATLASGDYYFQAATLPQGYQLSVQSGARVRIFVNGELSVGTHVSINGSGGAEQLLVLARGSLSWGNHGIFNGLAYAAGSLSVGNQGQIEGGLAAAGALSVGNHTTVTRNYQGVDEGLLSGLCRALVRLSANGDAVGPVFVGPGETVAFSGAVAGCSSPSWLYSRQWRESWIRAGAIVQQGISDNSSCNRSPLTYTTAFDAPGTYVVELRVEYRDCLLWGLFGCSNSSWQPHGSDEIVIEVASQFPLHHFEIDHDGVALTCQPESVTLKACADADCTTLVADPVVATLTPAAGWQGGNPITLNNGSGVATLSHTTPGSVTLGVTASDPAAQSPTRCRVGGELSSCELTFQAAGLAFDLPDLTAHKPSGPIAVQAVRQDDATQACVPAFENVSRQVDIWASYNSPTSGTRAPSVAGSEVSLNADSPTSLSLDFDGDGVAQIQLAYPDAGLMSLNMRYRGSEATNDAELVLLGADSFASIPAGWCIRTGVECDEADASCAKFKAAGEPFPLSIQAVGWEWDGDGDLCQGNPVTPNFANPHMPLALELLAPTGGDPGTLSPTEYDHHRSTDATTSVSATVSEVGVFRFLIPATTYLGRTLPSGQSRPTGRFIPARLELSLEDTGTLGSACTAGTNPFTYTGQGFQWQVPPRFEVIPQAAGGETTRNYYFDGFMRLAASGFTRDWPTSDDPPTLNGNTTPVPLEVTFSDGVLEPRGDGDPLFYQYSPADEFLFTKTTAARVPPFDPELTFGVTKVADADGVSWMPPATVTAPAPSAFQPDSQGDMRYGRWVMENVYAPETVERLLMPFSAEYWDGAGYVTNTDDSCTPWDTADIDDTEVYHSLVAASGTLDGGFGEPLVLEPNGDRGTDTLTWDVPIWLEDDWNQDEAGLEDPSATATFGVFRGNDRILYWRER